MALAPDPSQPAKTTAAPTSSGKKEITYRIAKGSKPAAPTSTGGTAAGGGGLPGLASERAAADTNAVVAGIVAQQQAAFNEAALRAAQQGQLGLASSKYLESLNLGDKTAGDYAAAAAAQRAAASGYSGGLQQTVSDAAAQVQANLAATGSQQTALDQGAAAGNVLYGLGGNLPAMQLDAIGPTVAAGLRALPAQTLGYGQQLAMGQLSAGQQEAARLNADIVSARAKQPTLAASYLDSLLAAQAKANEAAALAAYRNATLTQRGQIANQSAGIKQQQIDSLNAWRSTQAKISTFTAQSLADHRTAQDTNDTARINETAQHHTALEKLAAQNNANLAAYRNNQIDLGTFNANTSRINSQTSRINAQTSRINATKPPTASAAAGTAISVLHTGNSAYNGVASDQYGNPINYGTKAKPAYHISPGWHWGKGGQPVKNTKTPTVKAQGFSNSDVASLAGDLSSWRTGITGTSNGVPQKDPGSVLNWTQAYTRALTRGPSTKAWQNKALSLVNAEYGTPQSIAAATVAVDKAAGIGLADAVNHVIEAQSAGQLPVPTSYALDALAKAYGVPRVLIANLYNISRPR